MKTAEKSTTTTLAMGLGIMGIMNLPLMAFILSSVPTFAINWEITFIVVQAFSTFMIALGALLLLRVRLPESRQRIVDQRIDLGILLAIGIGLCLNLLSRTAAIAFVVDVIIIIVVKLVVPVVHRREGQ